MKKIKLALIGLAFTSFAFTQDTTNSKFRKGIYNVVAKDNSYSMKFAVRM